jgi:hypothetical protein
LIPDPDAIISAFQAEFELLGRLVPKTEVSSQ